MEAAAWFGAFGSVIGGLAAMAAIGIAQKQLTNLVRSLRQSTFACRPEKIRTAYKYLQGCKENWFNAADRLAFLLIKGYVKEKDWKPEYRPYFAELIAKQGRHFQEGTPYTNVRKLSIRWKIIASSRPSPARD
jgi:hypothetical protein